MYIPISGSDSVWEKMSLRLKLKCGPTEGRNFAAQNGIWELSHCSVAYPGLSGIHLCRVHEGGGEGGKV